MKTDLYNDEVNKCLFAAEQIAKDARHTFLGVGHLFFALLDNKADSFLADIQCLSNITLRISPADYLGKGGSATSKGGRLTMAMTPALKRTLLEAERLASISKSNQIHPKHLLAAICNVSYKIVARILRANQYNPTQFRQQLMDQLAIDSINDEGGSK